MKELTEAICLATGELNNNQDKINKMSGLIAFLNGSELFEKFGANIWSGSPQIHISMGRDASIVPADQLAPYVLYNSLMKEVDKIESVPALKNIKDKLGEKIINGKGLENLDITDKTELKLYKALLKNTERSLRTDEEQKKKSTFFGWTEKGRKDNLLKTVKKTNDMIVKLAQKLEPNTTLST